MEIKSAEEWCLRGLDCTFEEAIKCYDKAIEIEPSHFDGWFNKGFALYQLELYEEAIKCYDKAIEIDYNSSSWFNKGYIALCKAENLKESVDWSDCFEKATECIYKESNRDFSIYIKEKEIEYYDKLILTDSDDILNYVNKAQCLQKINMFDEAIRCWDRALELDDWLSFIYLNKSYCLQKLLKFEEAIDCADKAIENDNSPEVHEIAINCYDKGLEIDSDDADTWFKKGKALYRLERYEEAIECYDKAIEIEPDDADTWFEKGEALYRLERYEEAIECYDKAIEIEPGDDCFTLESAYISKLHGLIRVERYEEARECYDKAIKSIDDIFSLYFVPGYLIKLGLHEEAIKYLDKLLEIEPDNPAYWFKKGKMLNELKRYEEAIECYDKALKIEPGDAETWFKKGEALYRLERYEEAIECYDKAIEIDPDKTIIKWFMKGESLYGLERYEEAIKCYNKAIEIAPNIGDLWSMKGHRLYQLELYEEAIECYDKALEIESDDAETWLKKGKALYQLERYEKAIECYDKTLELGLKNVFDMNSIAVDLNNCGQYKKSIKCLNKVLKIDPNDEKALKTKEIVQKNFQQKMINTGKGKGKFSLFEIPDVYFDDIAGLEDVKNQINLKFLHPFNYRNKAKKFGQEIGGGLLLYGPPGTGKTLIAKAIAAEVDADFYTIKPSDLMDMYVGETEKNISRLFNNARNSERAVIFIDEIEALLPKRQGQTSTVMERAVPQFLNELDGVSNDNDNILFLGATNIPWNLDKAALRPGRFDEKVYIPPPDYEARKKIFQFNLKGKPLSNDIDFDELSKLTKNYSGADLAYLCNKACSIPFQDWVEGGIERGVCMEDFTSSFNGVRPSIDAETIQDFENYRDRPY